LFPFIDLIDLPMVRAFWPGDCPTYWRRYAAANAAAIEIGRMTANSKLRRDAIATRFASNFKESYRSKKG